MQGMRQYRGNGFYGCLADKIQAKAIGIDHFDILFGIYPKIDLAFPVHLDQESLPRRFQVVLLLTYVRLWEIPPVRKISFEAKPSGVAHIVGKLLFQRTHQGNDLIIIIQGNIQQLGLSLQDA